MSQSYAGKAVKIDLSLGKVEFFPISEEFKRKYIGGRGFITHWLFEQVSPEIHPLNSKNTLIFACGALTGTLAPTSSRLAVGAKAPETGINSVGNVGGFFGAKLKRAGLDAIIITGQASKPVYILIENEIIKIKNAHHLWGRTTNQTESLIYEENKDFNLSIACIGPAGENQVLFATIIVDCVRSGGRGGLGAVMGSKNLKAVAINGTGDVGIYDPASFWRESLSLIKKSTKRYFKKRWKSGTYGALTRYDQAGALSTHNAQLTSFEFINNISAETYNNLYKLPSMRACFGCNIPCWSNYLISDGQFSGFLSSSVNASTFKELGARCGLTNMDMILKAHDDLNCFGLDTISTPATISFAMECYQRGIIGQEETGGLELKWGNARVVLELIDQIAHAKGFGKFLGQGVKKCAQAMGRDAEKYALHVKGLETVATDPRGQPSWGLGYATSNRGACHMRAYSNFEYGGLNSDSMLRISGTTKIKERFGIEGKGRAVAFLENMRAFGDSLGLCSFMTRAELGFPEALTNLFGTASGIMMTPEELYRVGERIINLERLSNLHNGLTPSDDTLPERYLKEPVPEGPAKGRVCELAPMLAEYYKARDWDPTNGYPSSKKIAELELEVELEVLKSASW